MIRLLNEARTTIGDFADYDDLVDHINKTELSRIKLLNALNHTLGDPHALDQTRWSFIHYKHSFLKTIYSCMKEPPLTGIEREAFRQGIDLIEIHQGREDNPLQIPMEQDTDIESLKKDFCLAYCRARNYTLSETSKTSEATAAGGEDDLAV